MHKQIFILLTASVFITQVSFGATGAATDSAGDPRNVPPIVAPVGDAHSGRTAASIAHGTITPDDGSGLTEHDGRAALPASPPAACGAGARDNTHETVTARSDAESVLSDHESDDDTLRGLVAEARDLGFSTDSDVKRTLRGKRHQRKREIASAKAAERDAKRAAFLAKLGSGSDSKDTSPPAACGAGAGGAAAAAEIRRDDECVKGAGGAAATASAPTIAYKEVPMEQLTWGFGCFGHPVDPKRILNITLAIKLFPPKEQPIFVEHFKKLKSIYLGKDSRGTTMDTFVLMLSSISVDDRLAFIVHLEALSADGIRVWNQNAGALAASPSKNWSSLVDAMRYVDKIPVGYSDGNGGATIIGILAGVPAEQQKRAITQTHMIMEPLGSIHDEYFSKILRLVAAVRNRDAFEAQIFKALNTEEILKASPGEPQFNKVYAVVQAVASRT